MPRRRSLTCLCLAFVAAASLGHRDCNGLGFSFLTPQEGLLSLSEGAAEAEWSLFVPFFVRGVRARVSSAGLAGEPVELELGEGEDVPFGTLYRGRLDASVPGRYDLEATGRVRFLFFFRLRVSAASWLETTAIADADQCEHFNATECLLPYPSSRFVERTPDTPTGLRIEIPQVGIAPVNGPPIPAEMLSGLDGFSPTVQVLMHFPGGVDLAASRAPVLLDRGSAPPWIETRSPDDRSRDGDSPTVLLDARTGERILHWVELDARAEGDPERQLFILRPARSLVPGRRYLVAVRGLVGPGGSSVEPEAAFAALRDRRPTDIPSLEERRRPMERVFRRLRRHGVDRHDLQLAFDFTVQSEEGLTRQMLAMRDRAFEWLAEQRALGSRTFTVESIQDMPGCASNGSAHRRIVQGTFQSPLFLAEPPVAANVAQHTVDENDLPVQNGTMDAPFTISIPCTIEDESVPGPNTLLLGHGIFGTGEGLVRGIPQGYQDLLAGFEDTPPWNFIAGATNWSGWSNIDRLWVGLQIVGAEESRLQNFPAFPDRHRQGQVNTLVLSRMMKEAHWNDDPAFRIDDVGVFPEPGEGAEHGYYGISMGGVQGLFHAALSPDIERFGIDVGSMNFSMLLQRSTQFRDFEALLDSIGVTDPIDAILGQQLLHELWVSADPAGYATHITRDPLPGSIPKKVLMTVAWLDHQVSNQASEITARTLGLPNLAGSLQQHLVDLPDLAPGEAADSAYVVYDSGSFDIRDPADAPFIPPLTNQIVASSQCDPHGARPSIPAGAEQLIRFLQPGGRIENRCNGLCDAGEPFEIAGGAAEPCRPD